MTDRVQKYYYPFMLNCFHQQHDLENDTIGLMLSNSLPNLAWGVKADVTEIDTQGGYPAGGFNLIRVSSSQTLGTYRLILEDYNWTVTGQAAPAWQYAHLYNKSAPNQPLICYYDYQSAITLGLGSIWRFDFNQDLGAIRAPYPVT